MADLQDKVALITGGGTGIGRGIARCFAAEGAKVVLASRSREHLDAVAAEIAEAGGTALAVAADATDDAQVAALFREVMQAHGRLDILVNNAGIALGGAPDELDPADWRRVIDINLTGAFLCAAEAFRIMKPQGGGRILNIGSVSSQVPRPNSAPYTASKFGLEGLTRALALDGRPHGIAVSVLHPGNVMTRIWEGRESVAQTEGAIDPDDLAKVALTMVTLPPDINMLHGLILPVSMPFVGRG